MNDTVMVMMTWLMTMSPAVRRSGRDEQANQYRGENNSHFYSEGC
jgi:hypothetical protein